MLWKRWSWTVYWEYWRNRYMVDTSKHKYKNESFGESYSEEVQTQNNLFSSDDDGDAGMVKKFDIELFIEEVRKFPAVWNTSHEYYKMPARKKNSWGAMSKIFGKGDFFNYFIYLIQRGCYWYQAT